LNTNTSKKTGVDFIEINQTQVGQRLDNLLFKKLRHVPKTWVYRIIRKGEVRVNKKRIKPDYKVKIGDLVRIPPLRLDQKQDAEVFIPPGLVVGIENSVLFENSHILVIDKPAGVAVHSGSGVSFGIIDIMRRIRPDTEIELVHRLDRDTSGCLLLAKHRQSLLAMQRCFQDNSVTKVYLAVVKGRWPEAKREISHTLSKKTMANGERRVYADSKGQNALTRILEVEVGDGYSVLTIRLMTGRTHQIRVHCQIEGHEIAGDKKYGDERFNKIMKGRGVKNLMLHATSLELPESKYCQAMVFNSKLPTMFKELIDCYA
jgi:23S rRNA pseudouridine955/2504/2580 synthase